MNYTICKSCGSSNLLVENTKYKLWKCQNCDLIFCINIYSSKEIVETYNTLYNKNNQYESHQNEYLILSQGKTPKLGRSKRIILNYLIKNKCQSYFEIGAGVGIVGKYIQECNYTYLGIEIDPTTASKAVNSGINVLNKDIVQLQSFDKKFDAVVGFEVLEHIQDIDTSFKIINNLIKTNGFLGFTVPNYNKVLNYQNRKDRIHQDPPPIHLNFFTVNSIEKILAKNGFKSRMLFVRRWPYFNYKLPATYKFAFLALLGRYQGPTIICVAQKIEEKPL